MTCPEPGLCDEEQKPDSSQLCNTQPCTQWVVGPWGQVRGLYRGWGLDEGPQLCIKAHWMLLPPVLSLLWWWSPAALGQLCQHTDGAARGQ